jgi:23S rRNA (adenine2503-C2)-methyltransferase
MLKILEMTYADLAAYFRENHGKGPFLAGALYREYFKSLNATPWTAEAISRSPGLPALLERDWTAVPGEIVDEVEQDGVLKIIIRLDDGQLIESVIISMETHRTVCVSSQVGCRMGCRFCETARMGFVRNLTVEEIAGQVYTARHRYGNSVRNVVFMGMGEPMDNFDHVIKSIEVLSDQRGLDIARRHITLSTVGLASGIERLAGSNIPGINLAVSLNAAGEGLRTWLMPINQQVSLDTLQNVLKKFPLRRGAVIMINYVLIPGINDSRDCAEQLVNWLSQLEARVNLIPFNPSHDHEFHAPRQSEIDAFRRLLIEKGVNVQQRHPRGRGVMAACGQLGNRGRPLFPTGKRENPKLFSKGVIWKTGP